MTEGGPTFKDLYEVQTRTDEKIETVSSRLSRMEKGFIILTCVIASPKLGGPDATTIIGSVIHWL